MDSIVKQNNLPLDLQDIIYQFLYPNPKINYNKVVQELIHKFNYGLWWITNMYINTSLPDDLSDINADNILELLEPKRRVEFTTCQCDNIVNKQAVLHEQVLMDILDFQLIYEDD